MSGTTEMTSSDPIIQPPLGEASSNMKLLVIMATLLIIAIGLFLSPFGSSSTQVASDSERVQGGALAAGSNLDQTVTRAPTSLLSPVVLPSGVEVEAISRQLRQPIRLSATEAQADLPELTREVLSAFGHAPETEDRLHLLLVQALAERQSNGYIDAVLNAAAIRGEFVVPERLTRDDGGVDTMALLSEFAKRSTQ